MYTLLCRRRMATGCLLIILLSWFTAAETAAQTKPADAVPPIASSPQAVEILGLSVVGVAEEATRTLVLQASGLTVGQTITLPGDPSVAEAIRAIYRLDLFSDVKVVEERRAGSGAFLAIRVQEEPRLAGYTFEGVKKKHRDDLEKTIPLVQGRPVRPADVERSVLAIRQFYEETGYLLAHVDVDRAAADSGTVTLAFGVDPGPRVEVGAIEVDGNEALSDRRLQKRMDTKEDRWWRFWKKETFDEDTYQEDLQKIITYYNDRGYYDARILRDTVYVVEASDEPEVAVELAIREGAKYYIRRIDWEGNTLYPHDVLTQALGIAPGDLYNRSRIEQNLYANARSADVSSLYMNRGYMRFHVEPTIHVVEGDSLDLYFDVFEGDVYQFGEIKINGNSKTKEDVIRRELYTVPGQTFSRDAIQESIRRLVQLGYFSQESLAAGPDVQIDEDDKEVDLTYRVEEVSSDQLELSGTWGSTGLILQLRFGFNNFSLQNLFNGDAWGPLPSGDGQQLSVGIQTSGVGYQNYSLSFTEPWFRGKPHPVGFSLSLARYTDALYNDLLLDDSTGAAGGGLFTTSANLFYSRRLKWPDDKFTLSNSLRYQFYDNDGFSSYLPTDVSQEIVVGQTLSRSSLDHPLFPTSGSQFSFSVGVAPPLPGFSQYHKWRFTTGWNAPLASKLTLGISTDFGYIGSLKGGEVQFERFLVGGSPFDTQGTSTLFGRDVVYMRGYPSQAIGPRREGESVGGRILNKYTSELRWLAVQTPQLTAAPYLFLDAANTWDRFATYNPAQLFRSAGLGMRLSLPILGMLELVYGYNFDEFVPVGNHDGSTGWTFQFTLGRGFGQ